MRRGLNSLNSVADHCSSNVKVPTFDIEIEQNIKINQKFRSHVSSIITTQYTQSLNKDKILEIALLMV